MTLDLDELNEAASNIMDKGGAYTNTLCGFLQTCVAGDPHGLDCEDCPLDVVQPIELIQRLSQGTKQDILDEIKIAVLLN